MHAVWCPFVFFVWKCMMVTFHACSIYREKAANCSTKVASSSSLLSHQSGSHHRPQCACLTHVCDIQGLGVCACTYVPLWLCPNIIHTHCTLNQSWVGCHSTAIPPAGSQVMIPYRHNPIKPKIIQSMLWHCSRLVIISNPRMVPAFKQDGYYPIYDARNVSICHFILVEKKDPENWSSFSLLLVLLSLEACSRVLSWEMLQ